MPPVYGGAFVIGVALVIMLFALLSIWRRERIHGPTKSAPWRWFYRGLTVLLILFAAYMVVGAFVASTQPPY